MLQCPTGEIYVHPGLVTRVGWHFFWGTAHMAPLPHWFGNVMRYLFVAPKCSSIRISPYNSCVHTGQQLIMVAWSSIC